MGFIMRQKFESKEEVFDYLKNEEFDHDHFFDAPLINKTGKLHGLYYTDIVAGYLAHHVEICDDLGHVIHRERPYNQRKKHWELPAGANPSRIEETMLKDMRDVSYMESIGVMTDFHIPLKGSMKEKAGKIDMISRKGDWLYLIELRPPGSRKTALGAVLESYTNFNTVDMEKLYREYDIPESIFCIPAILVPKNGTEHKELAREDSKTMELVNRLGMYVFLYTIKKERVPGTDEKAEFDIVIL
ncbi:hypothetical protein LJC56_00445 [Christensenellaceae bacterium OttesenSCG-928-K19]|nr:hypothetical protein [Christensenellaceae bacterium OttesenSCG-928-K19]